MLRQLPLGLGVRAGWAAVLHELSFYVGQAVIINIELK